MIKYLILNKQTRTMEVIPSILILLTSMCLVGVIASPVSSNKRDKRMLDNTQETNKIVRPWPPIYNLCGVIGQTCKNTSECCAKNTCGYPNGYDESSPRCCGEADATGCKMTGQWPGTGCCVHTNHCEWLDQAKGTTHCRRTIYK